MKWDAGSSRAGPIPSACQALTDGYLHYDLHYIHCDTEHGPRSLVGAGQLDLTDYARQTCAALNEFLIACNLHKYYTTWFPYLKLLNWTCLILDELCAWALAISDWQRSLVITIIWEFCFICRCFNTKYIFIFISFAPAPTPVNWNGWQWSRVRVIKFYSQISIKVLCTRCCMLLLLLPALLVFVKTGTCHRTSGGESNWTLVKF